MSRFRGDFVDFGFGFGIVSADADKLEISLHVDHIYFFDVLRDVAVAH